MCLIEWVKVFIKTEVFSVWSEQLGGWCHCSLDGEAGKGGTGWGWGLICMERNVSAAIVGPLPFFPMRLRTSGGLGHTARRPCQLSLSTGTAVRTWDLTPPGSHHLPDFPHPAPPCSLVAVSPLTSNPAPAQGGSWAIRLA